MKTEELFPNVVLADEKFTIKEIPSEFEDFILKSIAQVESRLKEAYPRKRTLHKIAENIVYRYLIWPGCQLTLPPFKTDKDFRLLIRQSALDCLGFFKEYGEYAEAATLPPLSYFIEELSSGWIWMKGIYDVG